MLLITEDQELPGQFASKVRASDYAKNVFPLLHHVIVKTTCYRIENTEAIPYHCFCLVLQKQK